MNRKVVCLTAGSLAVVFPATLLPSLTLSDCAIHGRFTNACNPPHKLPIDMPEHIEQLTVTTSTSTATWR